MKNIKEALNFLWRISKKYIFLQLIKVLVLSTAPLINAVILKKVIDEGVYNGNLKIACQYSILMAVIIIFAYIIQSTPVYKFFKHFF